MLVAFTDGTVQLMTPEENALIEPMEIGDPKLPLASLNSAVNTFPG